jgi:hypothetical protein
MSTVLRLWRVIGRGFDLDRFPDRVVERICISVCGLERYLDGLGVHGKQQTFDPAFWAEQKLLQLTAQTL